MIDRRLSDHSAYARALVGHRLGAGGDFLAHRRDQLPGADETLARGIIGHAASFNASPRRSKARTGRRVKYDAGEVALPRRSVASGAVAPAYLKGSSFI